MSKDIEEQLFDIDKTLGGTSDYCIRGATFGIKEDLKSWGWFWDNDNKYWKLENVSENNAALKAVRDTPKTWIEKIK